MVELIKKYKEIILYLIFGVLTTVINVVVYALCTRTLSLDIYLSNVIAWILAVLFAYFTNRRYVFSSSAKTIKQKVREVISFYSCRLLTFGVDMLLMFAMIDLLKINDMVSKLSVNIIIIILNYILSKLVIFKK